MLEIRGSLSLNLEIIHMKTFHFLGKGTFQFTREISIRVYVQSLRMAFPLKMGRQTLLYPKPDFSRFSSEREPRSLAYRFLWVSGAEVFPLRLPLRGLCGELVSLKLAFCWSEDGTVSNGVGHRICDDSCRTACRTS